MAVIEFDGTINLDGDEPTGEGSEDWSKGLTAWPWPHIQTVEHLVPFLEDLGYTVEGFKGTILYRRWVNKLEWLKAL